MDTFPITARSLGLFFKVNANTLERAYKEILSDYKDWAQRDHATEWMLLPRNIGTRLCIDETMIGKDLTTFLSNKDGHCKRGSVIAAVRGTKASDVIERLMEIPSEQRNAVKEVTMDFSDSMYQIARTAFPNATIIIDCFHIIKRCIEAVEALRLKEKREAIKLQNKERAEFKLRLEQRAKRRAKYRAAHPKKYKGKKRGRKPSKLNDRFIPTKLSNGETFVDLLTRSKYLLAVSANEWTERQKKRAKVLFEKCPKVSEAYNLVMSLRCVFRDKSTTREDGKRKLHEWYDKVAACTLREVKAARDAIKYKEEEVLNYFINRSTNAAAESLNAKMKSFRAQVRGVKELSFFMFRVSMIFG